MKNALTNGSMPRNQTKKLLLCEKFSVVSVPSLAGRVTKKHKSSKKPNKVRKKFTIDKSELCSLFIFLRAIHMPQNRGDRVQAPKSLELFHEQCEECSNLRHPLLGGIDGPLKGRPIFLPSLDLQANSPLASCLERQKSPKKET